MTDCDFMKAALLQAELAFDEGEIPVGAVVVKDGQIIARARNAREADGNPLAHAEVCAMQAAAKHIGSWNLSGCTLYVTLEPCPMCAGAAIQAHVSRVVYGAESKGGACGSICNLFAMPFDGTPLLTGRIMEKECAALLSEFFRQKRAGTGGAV